MFLVESVRASIVVYDSFYGIVIVFCCGFCFKGYSDWFWIFDFESSGLLVIIVVEYGYGVGGWF